MLSPYRAVNETGSCLRKPRFAVGIANYMLSLLQYRWRQKAASLLVVLYSVCVVIPAAALIFADGATAAHCLTDDHHRVTAHAHQDGADHEHPNTGKTDGEQSKSCCGLFCLSAMIQTTEVALVAPLYAAEIPAVVGNPIQGRDTERIDRPPRTLLSL